MSIKLFNGHEIVGFSLGEFLPELLRMRKELEPVKQALVTKALAATAARAHDEALLGLNVSSKELSFISAAQQNMLDRQRASYATGRRDPFVDFSFSVTVIPASGRLLALTYTDQPQFRQLWEDKAWRRDFAYWDNTDPPDDISEDEWTDRWATWNDALGDSWVPGEVGYSYDLVDGRPSHPMADLDELALALPKAHERAKALALEYLIHLNKHKGIPEPQRHSEIMALRESSEWTAVFNQLTEKFRTHPLTVQGLSAEPCNIKSVD